ncbi:MAG: plastocyanin/azurin family copper-binding protein, partial [Acidimicrobiia bacterium]
MVLGALFAMPDEVAAAETTTVSLKGTRFNPAEVTVAPGDTVAWRNDDNTGHSVTFDDGSFDSHPSCTQGLISTVNCMDPGQTVQRKFNQPGDYPYTCK